MLNAQQSKISLLTNKTVLITGAAKGIGRGIAIEMAREGADVVIADVDEEESQKTLRLIRDLERSCLAVPTDVRDIEQNNRLVDRVLETFGKIDILVNNAGINTPGVDRILEISPENFDFVLSTNFRGHLFLSQRVAREMIERNIKGSLLFTSSSHARVISTRPAYSASKAAIETLVREAALELAAYGIRVNAVAPGWIAIRDEQERSNHFIPLGYKGAPEDIAHAMVFLASEKASYITGQTLTVDGGFSIAHTHYWRLLGMLPDSSSKKGVE